MHTVTGALVLDAWCLYFDVVTDCNCKADARWQVRILHMHTSWKSVSGVVGAAIYAAATPLRVGAARLAATGWW